MASRSQEQETVVELLTREEKEALLDQKIKMMKVRNAERMKKFQEIEEDKRRAEQEGRAVTLKQSTYSDNEDDEWPKRPDRFDDDDRGQHQQRDLRNVLQRKPEQKPYQEQPPSGGRQGNSKYKALLEDGPPPDPAYNYLADRGRDGNFSEKSLQKEDSRNWRGGFSRENTRGRRQRPDYTGTNQPFQRHAEDERHHEEEQANYTHWRKERENIDRQRVDRQKTKEGWKREWDREKQDNQSQRIESRSYRDACHRSNEEPARKDFANSHAYSGEPFSRGGNYRGGRGRGRSRPDFRGFSPKPGSTPDRDVEPNVLDPLRHQHHMDGQRPGGMARQMNIQVAPGVNVNHSPSQVIRSEVARPLTVGRGHQSGQYQQPGLDRRESPREGVAGGDVQQASRNPTGCLVITVENQGPDGTGDPSMRVIQNKQRIRTEIKSPETRTEAELLTHDHFPKTPKKGIGSGRLLPPPKGKGAFRGKDSSRRAVAPRGRRPGNHWTSAEKDNEEVTIGIAVITTPGDRAGNVEDKNIVNKTSEVEPSSVVPSKKETICPRGDVTTRLNVINDEIDDDDDDEWEDVDEGSAEFDESLTRDHNKSNESINRFIEEITLHPDGTNWNIDADGTKMPWSEQVDAESQERHRLENDWPALEQRPSDPYLDSSFQSSCSIVESPFEQNEVLSSLLAAACDASAEGPDLKPSDFDEDSQPDGNTTLTNNSPVAPEQSDASTNHTDSELHAMHKEESLCNDTSNIVQEAVVSSTENDPPTTINVSSGPSSESVEEQPLVHQTLQDALAEPCDLDAKLILPAVADPVVVVPDLLSSAGREADVEPKAVQEPEPSSDSTLTESNDSEIESVRDAVPSSATEPGVQPDAVVELCIDELAAAAAADTIVRAEGEREMESLQSDQTPETSSEVKQPTS